MKRLLPTAVCLLMVSPVFSQAPDHETQNNGEHYYERLKTDLKLNAEQQDKIKKIMQEHRPKIAEAKKKQAAIEAELKMLRQSETESIRVLLDADQRDSFDEIQVQFRKRLKGAGGGGDHGHHHGGEKDDQGKKERWWQKDKKDLKDEDMGPPEIMHHQEMKSR